MKLNRIILQAGFTIISLAMVSGIAITNYLTLDEPVFLRYCIETEVYTENTENINTQNVIQLQYITNRYDTREVIGINFPDAPDWTSFASETEPYGNTFTFFPTSANRELGVALGRYSLHTVYVTQSINSEEKWSGEKELNSASIEFSDGSKMDVDIGRIILYHDADKEDTFTNEISTSSNNVTFSAAYQVDQDITLLNVQSPLMKDFSEIMTIKIDGRNPDILSDIKYKKGEHLYIKSSLDSTKQNSYKYDVYDIRPIINYKKVDGSTGSMRLRDFTWQRSFNDIKDALSYLRGRGVI